MKFKANDYNAKEILKFMRQNADLTQEALANKMNKSKNWVKNNEQGLNRYFFEDLVKVAEICNVDIIFIDKKIQKNNEQ